MRYHLTSVRMAISRKKEKTKAGEGMEERESSYIVGGNMNRYDHYGEQYVGSLKI